MNTINLRTTSELVRHPKSAESPPTFPEFGTWLENLFNTTSTQIAELTQDWTDLYATISELQTKDATRQLNLAGKDTLAELTKRYWQIGKDLDQLKEQLAQLEDEWLRYAETGEIQPKRQLQYDTAATEFVAAHQPHVSRRKQRIAEEKARTGSDPRNSPDPLVPVGDGYYHLASGRNRTALKSSHGVAAYAAEGAFYQETVDTHGGKSRKRKKRSPR